MKKSAQVKWEKGVVVEELVKEFTKGVKDKERVEQIRNEIEGSLVLDDWYTGAGLFEFNGEEYMVVESEDRAWEIAEEEVRNMLESEPEIFNKDFLARYVKVDEIAKGEMVKEEEMIVRERLLDEYGVDSESELDEEQREKFEEEVEEWMYEFKEGIEDPVEYFVEEQGIYTLEELLEQRWVYIDVDKAARDAVRIDGWTHFLATYDERAYETKGGLVYFRR